MPVICVETKQKNYFVFVSSYLAMNANAKLIWPSMLSDTLDTDTRQR